MNPKNLPLRVLKLTLKLFQGWRRGEEEEDKIDLLFLLLLLLLFPLFLLFLPFTLFFLFSSLVRMGRREEMATYQEKERKGSVYILVECNYSFALTKNYILFIICN